MRPCGSFIAGRFELNKLFLGNNRKITLWMEEDR